MLGTLHPNIILCGIGTTCVPSVHHAARFHKHDAAFLGRDRTVFHALWNDVHFPCSKWDRLISELKCHLTIQNNKHFIRVGMRMPNEVALNFGEFKLVIIHLGNDAG